jgi:adenylyl-sulfate kinase
MASEGFTVWFTGLSASGKSELATLLKRELDRLGYHAEVLEGAEVRKTISDDLGFTPEDRLRNIRRMGEVCDLLSRNGIVAIAAAESPVRAAREANREKIGRYVEVYCRCPMEVLRARDYKGLYAAADRGEVTNVAGVDTPYEEPEDAEVVLDTDRLSNEECIQIIMETLERLGYISRTPRIYTAEEEARIKRHIKRSGYL